MCSPSFDRFDGRLVPIRAPNFVEGIAASGCDPLHHRNWSLAKKLSETVRELQLGDRVILAGWQERQQLKIMLHAARVFAFYSLTSAEIFWHCAA